MVAPALHHSPSTPAPLTHPQLTFTPPLRCRFVRAIALSTLYHTDTLNTTSRLGSMTLPFIVPPRRCTATAFSVDDSSAANGPLRVHTFLPAPGAAPAQAWPARQQHPLRQESAAAAAAAANLSKSPQYPPLAPRPRFRWSPTRLWSPAGLYQRRQQNRRGPARGSPNFTENVTRGGRGGRAAAWVDGGDTYRMMQSKKNYWPSPGAWWPEKTGCARAGGGAGRGAHLTDFAPCMTVLVPQCLPSPIQRLRARFGNDSARKIGIPENIAMVYTANPGTVNI
ncbi:hypothetical protein B0H14DRAFT_2643486 [Mycena olivaceomarginata]|nr:hypothetical protein B0H14DRAFT_2643486 [Mycena olivaceomarginata]